MVGFIHVSFLATHKSRPCEPDLERMLCQTCQKIFRGSCPHKTSKHHFYIHQLEQAAFDACHICRVLWHAISDHLSARTEEALETPRIQEAVSINPISQYCISHKASWSKDNTHNISELSFTVNRNGVGCGGRAFTFCLQPMRKAGSLLESGDPVDPNSWSLSMISAKKWLHLCLESHDRCRSAQWSGTAKKLPTRLLQIGQPSAERIRLLLDPKREAVEIQYATLSHCWGTSHVLRLTLKSLECLQEGIAISELGQTFQDAIFTARSLGIQFIWIDSLCIFQDSREDWAREAPLMTNVYRHAVINIAASVAADSETSCFRNRDLSLIEPCTIQTAWVDCQNDNYYLYYDKFWHYAFKDMPLMKRAWVVQELLLAPRVLHLNGTQLFWECYDLAACESYPGGVPPNMESRRISREAMWDAFNAEYRSAALEICSGTPLKNNMWKLWTGIVETYTASKLTYTSDKLVALSGIVKIMERALDEQYCAGLWRKNLVTQLLWVSICDEQQVRPRPHPYRAPSWSWASLDGPISPGISGEGFYTKIETLINIIDCKIESTTDDTTSAVTAGTLKLSGWLASIRLRSDSQNEWSCFFNGTLWRTQPTVYIRLDCKPPALQFHCLPLFVDNHQLPHWSISCLLLCPTGDMKGQFRRFGVLHAFAGAFGMEDWAGFRGSKNEDWLEYEALSSNDQYIISIV